MKLFYLFFTIFLFSCSIDVSESTPYYQFTENDLEYLPMIYQDTSKTFLFKNERDEEVTIQVKSFKLTKKNGGGIGVGTEFIYYDQLVIELQTSFDCDVKRIQIAKEKEQNSLTHWFYSSVEDPCNNGYIIENIGFPNSFQEITINNKTYDRVVEIFINKNIFFHPDYSINKVYFDMKNGFIAFEDTELDITFTYHQ